MFKNPKKLTKLITIAASFNVLICLNACHHSNISSQQDVYMNTFETTVLDCVQAAQQSFPFVSAQDLKPYCACVLIQAGVNECKSISDSRSNVNMTECFNSKYLITDTSSKATKLFVAKTKESCISLHLEPYKDQIPAAIRKGVFEGQKRIILEQFSKASIDSQKKNLYVSCIIDTYLDECGDKTYSGYLNCLNNEDEKYLIKTVKKCKKHLVNRTEFS